MSEVQRYVTDEHLKCINRKIKKIRSNKSSELLKLILYNNRT